MIVGREDPLNPAHLASLSAPLSKICLSGTLFSKGHRLKNKTKQNMAKAAVSISWLVPQSRIHSFSIHLLDAYYVPST